MCLINNKCLINQLLEKYGDDEAMMFYKQYKIGCDFDLQSTLNSYYRDVKLNLDTNKIQSDSLQRKLSLRNGMIICKGIHVYKNKPEQDVNRKDLILIRVWGNKEDLLGVGIRDAVFKKVYIDIKDYKILCKRFAGKSAKQIFPESGGLLSKREMYHFMSMIHG